MVARSRYARAGDHNNNNNNNNKLWCFSLTMLYFIIFGLLD